MELWTPQGMQTTNTRILAEVKSGKTVTIESVRAFCRVMDKHKATAGIFITIKPVTAGMRQEAAGMGTFEHNNVTYPRVQFWQIDDDYFENLEIVKTLIRLPEEWLRPMQKSERPFADEQLQLNVD